MSGPILSYRPTAGILRALTDVRGATETDREAARRRGLLDHRLTPTPFGALVIRAELHRRQGYARG